jgi:hypothetical protein
LVGEGASRRSLCHGLGKEGQQLDNAPIGLQALALDDYDHEQIQDCDRIIEAHLQELAWPEVPPLEPTRRVHRRRDNEGTFNARQRLHHVAGVGLTALEGSEASTALVVLKVSQRC